MKTPKILTFYPAAKQCGELLQNPVLRGWEKLFVSTLARCQKPGRRQLEKLQAIAEKLNAINEGSEA
jgi:hypothetical protein